MSPDDSSQFSLGFASVHMKLKLSDENYVALTLNAFYPLCDPILFKVRRNFEVQCWTFDGKHSILFLAKLHKISF